MSVIKNTSNPAYCLINANHKINVAAGIKSTFLVGFGIVVISLLTACGGGGGSSAGVGSTPSVATDCVIDQSVIGSCTLG